jgi:hypothetical protein
VGIEEIRNLRRLEYEELLHTLIKAKPARFDTTLPTLLPKAHGLYAISTVDAPEGEYLHAGKTQKGRSGLLGRIWQQHYQIGGSPGDLVEKVRVRGHGHSANEAREYIRQHCQVQWVIVEDGPLRGWAEHYVLAMLKPIWGN